MIIWCNRYRMNQENRSLGPLGHVELIKVDTSQISDEEAEKVRQDFQGRGSKWMVFHNIRTLTGIASTVLLFAACLLK